MVPRTVRTDSAPLNWSNSRSFERTAGRVTNRSKVIWNKHAYKTGTLLSRHHLPHVLQLRQDIKYEGVVGPRNRWVDQVRVSTKESVPYFDPRAATQGADVLVLLQDPSSEAQLGSGFISRDNNDPTAHNITLAAEAGGLPYSGRAYGTAGVPSQGGSPLG